MSFVLGLVGSFVGVILVILVIALVIYIKIKKILNEHGVKRIRDIKRQADDAIIDISNTPKSVNGMTSLVEPQILSDFPDFNKELVFAKIESNLRMIFNSIENLQITKNNDLELINDKLKEEIDDLKERNVKIRYDNVVFHRHALKRYQKNDGIATVTTSSTLEYDYHDSRNKKDSSLKTQTRYTCKFIYVYDVEKIPKNSNKQVFIINCPNCGAPLTSLESGGCVYCGSHIEEINLKTWKMSSFSDDYNNIEK